MSGIRYELAHLYRLARRGELPIEDLSRYAVVLRTIAELVLASDLEKRVDDVERYRTGIGLREIKQLRQAA
jgi:hypothetical protein